MSDSPQLAIGLMSGTSLDGIDCALVDVAGLTPTLIDARCTPYAPALRKELLALCAQPQISLDKFGSLHIEVGRAFAACVNEMLARTGIASSEISVIGSHGQTVLHRPDTQTPFSLQIGDPNSIAQLTGITTVADLRGRDIAAGGQGAPIAPLLHRQCFKNSEQTRMIVNVGGIANLTALHKDGTALAFDTGPANVLMDYWIARHKDVAYDADGAWAASGEINPALLSKLLAEPYLALPPPKSTGRELFNGAWLEERLQSVESETGQAISAQDVQATVLELSSQSIAYAVNQQAASGAIYLCGGGAHNTALRNRLAQLCSGFSVESTRALGMDPDWVEAIAFAWMAKQRIEGTALDTTPFTGASQPVVLGGVYSGI